MTGKDFFATYRQFRSLSRDASHVRLVFCGRSRHFLLRDVFLLLVFPRPRLLLALLTVRRSCRKVVLSDRAWSRHGVFRRTIVLRVAETPWRRRLFFALASGRKQQSPLVHFRSRLHRLPLTCCFLRSTSSFRLPAASCLTFACRSCGSASSGETSTAARARTATFLSCCRLKCRLLPSSLSAKIICSTQHLGTIPCVHRLDLSSLPRHSKVPTSID